MPMGLTNGLVAMAYRQSKAQSIQIRYQYPKIDCLPCLLSNLSCCAALATVERQTLSALKEKVSFWLLGSCIPGATLCMYCTRPFFARELNRKAIVNNWFDVRMLHVSFQLLVML